MEEYSRLCKPAAYKSGLRDNPLYLLSGSYGGPRKWLTPNVVLTGPKRGKLRDRSWGLACKMLNKDRW